MPVAPQPRAHLCVRMIPSRCCCKKADAQFISGKRPGRGQQAGRRMGTRTAAVYKLGAPDFIELYGGRVRVRITGAHAHSGGSERWTVRARSGGI